MTMARSERKAWAREHMRGLENTTQPSFTPDLKHLDEDGIRWDVQQTIKHGFCSTFCTIESGLTLEENKRFLEIVADEARGRCLVSFSLILNSFEDCLELMQHAERVGVDNVLLTYPPNFQPETLDEAVRVSRDLCEATNLGVVLWATQSMDFERFHPSHVPFALYDQLVDLPNVVAMKVGFPEPGMVFEVFERFSDKVLVNIGNAAMLPLLPILRKRYANVQWGGAGNWEMWQSPEKPYLVDYFRLVLEGRVEEAMKIYWHLAPVNRHARATGGKHQIGGIDLNMNPWPAAKYITWSVGGNGGLTRQPAMPLTPEFMQMRKAMLRQLGITPREPDEEFFVGRVNYAKGIRPTDAMMRAAVAAA